MIDKMDLLRALRTMVAAQWMSSIFYMLSCLALIGHGLHIGNHVSTLPTLERGRLRHALSILIHVTTHQRLYVSRRWMASNETAVPASELEPAFSGQSSNPVTFDLMWRLLLSAEPIKYPTPSILSLWVPDLLCERLIPTSA